VLFEGRWIETTLEWLLILYHALFGSCCVILVSANLVLHRTIERIHVGKKYGDIPRGIFVIRGENVVLLGEIVSTTGIFATI